MASGRKDSRHDAADFHKDQEADDLEQFTTDEEEYAPQEDTEDDSGLDYNQHEQHHEADETHPSGTGAATVLPTTTSEMTDGPESKDRLSTMGTTAMSQPSLAMDETGKGQAGSKTLCARICRWFRYGNSEALQELIMDLPVSDQMKKSRPSNYVQTARYTLFNFLFKCGAEQFRNLSNVYFLVIVILAILGTKTNLFDSPYAAGGTLLGLVLVVAFTMAFEGYYDIKRHREDKEVNNRIAYRLRPGDGHVEEIPWSDVRPGDLLKVYDRSQFPADLLFVTSCATGNKCYVETANIDGETNLKIKHVPEDLVDRCILPDQAASLQARVRYDPPNSMLTFSGTIRVYDDEYVEERSPKGYKNVSLDTANILLRGSVLRNTPWILGFVLYAGPETKVVQSSSNPPTKMSRLQKLINKIIVLILVVDIIMCTLSSLIEIYGYPSNTEFYYLMQSSENAFGFPPYVANVCTFIVLYSSLLPISLLFATTFSNFWQAMFIHWDLDMYHEETDTPAKCNAMELVQELGQVSYVFSDKTGTLTRNEMKLVGCTVDSQVYGVGNDEPGTATSSSSTLREIFADAIHVFRKNHRSRRCTRLTEFWRILAVCHTVLVDTTSGSIMYNAEGPDEEALVSAAAEVGMRLLSTDNNIYRISVEMRDDVDPEEPDKVEEYKVLAINQFNSTRKRMSVLVRTNEGKYMLYVKGADTVMFELTRESRSQREREMMSQLCQHLDAFANDGLRTLVMARKELSNREFEAWKARFDEANSALGEKRNALLEEAAAAIEHNLEIVGASAIEDRLQDGVPETLVSLREAGVKTWVLTGDKVETAINIAFSARLFSPEMELIKITSDNPEENMKTVHDLQALLVPSNLCKNSERRKHGREVRKEKISHVGRAMEHGVHRAFDKARRAARSVFKDGRKSENGFEVYEEDLHDGDGRKSHRKRRSWKQRRTLSAGMGPNDGSVHSVNSEGPEGASPYSDVGPRRSGNGFQSPTGFWSRLSPSGSGLHKSSHGSGTTTPMVTEEDSESAYGDDHSSVGPESSSSRASMDSSSSEHPSHRRTPSAWRRPVDILPPGVDLDDMETNEHELQGNESNLEDFEAKNMALVISGNALRNLLASELGTAESEAALLSIARLCSVVVACRVSPKQKALVVRMVKEGVKVNGSSPVTLAIGDGANDVAMIQEARVGVGISGHEGRQAVNSSDFAIAQFRFLKDLMLVHGRWNYRRSASMVLFVFYSSVLFVLTAAVYNFYNKFSGSSSFPTFLTTVFSYPTQVPITVIACLNKDISRKTALEYPAMYISGRKNLHMDRIKAFEYIFKSFLHAFFICAITMIWAGPGDVDILTLGTTTYIATIWVCVARTCLETYTWTWLTFAIVMFGFVSMFVFEPIYYGLDPSIYVMYTPTVMWDFCKDCNSIQEQIFGKSPRYLWKCVFLILVVCIGFDMMAMHLRRQYFPSLVDVVIEIDRGYGDSCDNKKSRLHKVNKLFRKLAQPLLIPQSAITEVFDSVNIQNISRAANRSAFDYDHPEDENKRHILRVFQDMVNQHQMSRLKDGRNVHIPVTVASPSIMAVSSPNVLHQAHATGIDIRVPPSPRTPTSMRYARAADTSHNNEEHSPNSSSSATSYTDQNLSSSAVTPHQPSLTPSPASSRTLDSVDFEYDEELDIDEHNVSSEHGGHHFRNHPPRDVRINF